MSGDKRRVGRSRAAKGKPLVALCLPVFQSEENVDSLIARIPSVVDKIYLVVDEPGKKMLDLFNKIIAKDKRVKVIANPVRRGVGNALRQAIDSALGGGYDIFVIMAANGKDNPREIPRLVGPIIDGGYDYVQGSRYLKGSMSVNLPFIRKIVIKTLPIIWSILNGVKYTEITNGFRAYRLSIFKDRKINIWQEWLDKYQMEYYIHYKATTGNYKFTEVPVSKIYRKENSARHTKIRLKDGWQIISPVIYLKLGIKK